MQTRARMAFAVVGAPGVDTSVLAASIMDLALINICREGGRKEKYRSKKEEKDGREISAICLNPLIMRKKLVSRLKLRRAAKMDEEFNAGFRIKMYFKKKGDDGWAGKNAKLLYKHVETTTGHLKPNLNSFNSPLGAANIWRLKSEDAKHTHSSEPGVKIINKYKKGALCLRK